MPQFLAFEGDSITNPTTGVAAASRYYYVAQSAISPFPQGGNDAVSGSGIATVIARSATIDSWFAPIAGPKVLFLFLGANDQGGTTPPPLSPTSRHTVWRAKPPVPV